MFTAITTAAATAVQAVAPYLPAVAAFTGGVAATVGVIYGPAATRRGIEKLRSLRAPVYAETLAA